MESEQLFKIKAKTDARGAGQAFAGDPDGDSSDFFRALLKNGEYSYIAEFFAGAYGAAGGELSKEDGRFFQLFIDRMERCKIGYIDYAPLLFASYKAPRGSALKSWTEGVDRYLYKLLYADFESMARLLLATDGTGLSYRLITAADKPKGEKLILNELFEGQVKNRAKARQLAATSPAAFEATARYDEMSRKGKAELIKLMLLNKRMPAALAFLDGVIENESSKVLKRLIYEEERTGLKKRGYPAVEYCRDDKGVYSPLVLDKTYKVRIKEYKVKLPRVKSLEAKAALKEKVRYVRRDVKAKIEYLYECMVTGELWSFQAFRRRLCDQLFAAICERMFFAVFDGDVFEDIVVVDKNKIYTLEGKEIAAEGKFLNVVHPLAMTGKYAYLTMQKNLGQPFDQVGREVFTASEADKAFNVCERFKGALTSVAELKKNVKGTGFKVFEKNGAGDYTSYKKSWHEILCVVKTSPFKLENQSDLVSLSSVRFYAQNTLLESGGGNIGSLPVMPVEQIDPVLFSEFLYGVRKLSGANNA